MNWTDDELDKLFVDASKQVDVPYSDSYWSEMEAMLSNEPKRKAGFFWWTSAGVLLLFTFGVATAIYYTNSDPVYKTASIDSKSQEFNPSLHSTGNKKLALKKHISNATLNPNSIKNAEQHLGESKQYFEKHTSQTNVRTLKVNSTSNEFSKKEIVSTQFVPIVNEIELSQKIPSIVNEITSVEQVNKSEEVSRTQLQVSNLGMLPVTNLETGIAKFISPTSMPQPDLLPLIKTKRFGFYVSAAAGFGQSFLKTKTNNDLYQISLSGGIEFYKRNWLFGAGISIQQQHVNNIYMNTRSQYYSFGLINVNRELNYDQFISIGLPISASYSFGRSSIGMQFTPSYLIGSRLAYTEQTETTSEHDVLTNQNKQETKFVSSDNLEKFGLNTSFNYNYRLKGNLFLDAKVGARINPLLLNSGFNGTTRNLPLIVELGITKRF